MNNVNAPAHLERYAAENGIDLTEFHSALAELVAMNQFFDPGPPLANDVLMRLRMGATIDDATGAAKANALNSLR